MKERALVMFNQPKAKTNGKGLLRQYALTNLDVHSCNLPIFVSCNPLSTISLSFFHLYKEKNIFLLKITKTF